VVTRHTFKSYELTAGSSEMEELVQKLWGREGKQSSANLYRSLITPLLPDLQTPLVALLPTGLLNQVSFAMLSEDGQHYFGDEHTLYYLPNAAALSIPPGTLPRLPVMLSVSNPNAGTHLAELKATEPEATQVAEIYGTQAIHGITESEFRAKAPLADLIHVAAHAEVVPSNPAFSRIYLKQDEQNDGNLQINEIEKLDLRRVDLVTLSACSTAAQASLGANDDFQSINRAFLDAGVRSVIATLWQVSDNTASILMPSFYQHLREGKSKAVALQLAQQEARALHPNQQSNDWAAFILTGQPGVEQ
jgi:CHAT domain-containing protein